MSRILKISAILFFLALAAFASLHTGLARRAFFELFAYVKGVDVLGPTTVREPAQDSPYQHWLETARNEIPLFEGLVIDDVATEPLKPWPQMGEGITGLYLHLADYQITDGRLLEIPPGGHTAGQQHLFEKGIYFLAGSGHTVFQQEGRPPQRVNWQAGDLVSVPLNVRHQHFNDGSGPARMLAVSTFPLMLNVIDDIDFVTENPWAFIGRYDGEPDYFRPSEAGPQLIDPVNFARDIPRMSTVPFDYRGKGNRSVRWLMAGNSMLSLHISEMPPNTYKKAHRHSGDAFILLLSGEGFSLTWPSGFFDKRQRVDWKAGTLFVPPMYWYHQHLNTGATPARYLAINTPTVIRNIGLRFIDQLEVDMDGVRAEWEKEIARQSVH